MFNKTKTKNAFTLAEVLITLVIIGVVAALTIPTAINKYKEEELKSQFKKAYSTILQAMYKTEMNDFFGYAKCYYGVDGAGSATSGCRDFFDAFAKNLQLQKVCKGNAKSGGCVPSYSHYANPDGCYGFTVTCIENQGNSYVLNNGQILILYGDGSMPLFLYDINGHKGPNRMGTDLFSFKIERNKNTGLFTNSGICEYLNENGGKSTKDMIKYVLSK